MLVPLEEQSHVSVLSSTLSTGGEEDHFTGSMPVVNYGVSQPFPKGKIRKKPEKKKRVA